MTFRRTESPPERVADAGETDAEALARLYDLDLTEDPGDLDLYRALAGRTTGPLVELAVGSGRVAVPLAAEGRRVVGVDLDPAMLARARRRWEAITPSGHGVLDLVAGDMLDAAIPGAGSFGLAILALNSIMLLPNRAAQRRVVARMAALVAPGGTVVVDAWQASPDDLGRFDGRLALEWLRRDPVTGFDVTKVDAAWYDAATRTVTLTTIFEEAPPGGAPRRWTRTDVLRLVAADELRSFAEDAGLEVEVLAGDHDLGPLGPGAERAVLVARRPR